MRHDAIQIRFAKRYRVLIALLAAFGMSGSIANPAHSELLQLDIIGTVRFAGCPYDGMCWLYPLMWAVSSGESMTLRVIYDPDVPLSGDYSEADYYYAEYDHAIPLQSPLGMEISFGSYGISVGSNGAAAEDYWISVFDVIESYPNFPDIQESIGIQIEVPPGSVILPGPPGFHDLEFHGIYCFFTNFGGHDFLVGPSIPAGFPLFDWDDIQLRVEVSDPIYDQLGFAFINIDQVTLTPVPEPSVRLGVLAGAAVLGLLHRTQRGKRRRQF